MDCPAVNTEKDPDNVVWYRFREAWLCLECFIARRKKGRDTRDTILRTAGDL